MKNGENDMPIAFVLLITDPDHMESVLEALKKIDGVEEAYMVYGVHDIVAKVKVDTIDKIKDLIVNVRLLDKVRSTQTMIVMEETK